MSTEDDRIELLHGTLDLVILRTLLPGPAHGHAIVKAIERNSEELLLVEQGSLYPALHQLITRGWIGVTEGTSENNRRRNITARRRRAGSNLRLKPPGGLRSPAPSPGFCVPQTRKAGRESSAR